MQSMGRPDSDRHPAVCSGAINHFLFVTINHAGVDGLSTFHVFRTFFHYVGEIAMGRVPPSTVSASRKHTRNSDISQHFQRPQRHCYAKDAMLNSL